MVHELPDASVELTYGAWANLQGVSLRDVAPSVGTVIHYSFPVQITRLQIVHAQGVVACPGDVLYGLHEIAVAVDLGNLSADDIHRTFGA